MDDIQRPCVWHTYRDLSVDDIQRPCVTHIQRPCVWHTCMSSICMTYRDPVYDTHRPHLYVRHICVIRRVIYMWDTGSSICERQGHLYVRDPVYDTHRPLTDDLRHPHDTQRPIHPILACHIDDTQRYWRHTPGHTDDVLGPICHDTQMTYWDLFALCLLDIRRIYREPKPIYDIAWHTHVAQRPAYAIFARTETCLTCYLFTTSCDVRMSYRDLQRYLRHAAWCTYVTQRPILSWEIDRSLLQNIVSFMGLFCKRDL